MSATSLLSWWQKIVKQTDLLWLAHWPVIIGIVLLVGLRLPNFTEPYWYGDEGIYLTIGQSLRFGERMYAEIVDHKTPLIYYLAMVPNQLAFRWLLLGWMIVTTVLFYDLTRKITRSRAAHLATVISFVLLTTLPRLEGNIPNGELFVMGFIVVGLWLIARTAWWHSILDLPLAGRRTTHHQTVSVLLGGTFLGLAILTKVPALFDAVAAWWAVWLATWQVFTQRSSPWLKKIHHGLAVVLPSLLVGIGLIAPIMLSIGYFFIRGSGSEYVEFGLLYNFHYAGNWNLPLQSPLLLWLFTLPGKTVVMGLLLICLTLLQVKLTRKWSWVLGWLVLSVFASLLSNRPYPHYFLQLIPPLTLLVGLSIETIGETISKSVSAPTVFFRAIVVSGFGALLTAIWLILGVWYYPTLPYYTRWWQLMTRQIDVSEYRRQFNPLMDDNYQVAQRINQDPEPYLFIWGTNPTLYAQTGKIPTGRFTVSFHIKDLGVYEETFADLVRRQPNFVVVMNDEQDTWPELNAYLSQWYLPDSRYTYFTLWRRVGSNEQL